MTTSRRLLRAMNRPTVTYTYRNGTYTATKSYSVPGDTNSITTTITIVNDMVTAISDQNTAAGSTSWSYIDSFEASIAGVVVGKPLLGLAPSRVGGASLTTQGFNGALSAIRTQAAN